MYLFILHVSLNPEPHHETTSRGAASDRQREGTENAGQRRRWRKALTPFMPPRCAGSFQRRCRCLTHLATACEKSSLCPPDVFFFFLLFQKKHSGPRSLEALSQMFPHSLTLRTLKTKRTKESGKFNIRSPRITHVKSTMKQNLEQTQSAREMEATCET